MTGSIGLAPTLAALDAGRTLALANKESLIAGGPLVKAAVQRPGQLVPVDSEHSALAQCLRAGPADEVRRLVLTASGGPFRGRSRDELTDVTPAEALAHPTWDMGPVVTVNSATLVNKGLELIEAHLLFDVPYDRIDVVVHPQSRRALDGRVRRRLDDRPGQPARHAAADRARPWLAGPGPGRGARLDWTTASDLGVRAARRGGVPRRTAGSRGRARRRHGAGRLNAANEVCVEAFLAGRLRVSPRSSTRSPRSSTSTRLVTLRLGNSPDACRCSACRDLGARARRELTGTDRGSADRMTLLRSACSSSSGLLVSVCCTRPGTWSRPALRHEGDAVLRRLRPDAVVVPARRDRVRRQGDPGRRLRQDRRDDPARGELAPEDEPRAFWRQPAGQRTIVLVAGSATHFLLAVLIFFVAGVHDRPAQPGLRHLRRLRRPAGHRAGQPRASSPATS